MSRAPSPRTNNLNGSPLACRHVSSREDPTTPVGHGFKLSPISRRRCLKVITHIHIYRRTHRETYTDAHRHICRHTYTYLDTHTHTNRDINKHRCTQTYTHPHMHTHRHIHRHTHTNTHRDTYIYRHANRYTHTQTHNHVISLGQILALIKSHKKRSDPCPPPHPTYPLKGV